MIQTWNMRVSKFQKLLRRTCILTGVTVFCIGAFVFLQIVMYVTSLTFDLNKTSHMECLRTLHTSLKGNNSSDIPKHIHQLYFYMDNKPIPKNWEKARTSWSVDNRDFEYTLWDLPMFTELLEGSYPWLVPVYKGYSHWVMQADVARLVVLYHVGGVYADLDIKCKTPLNKLFDRLHAEHADAVLYWTRPFGTSNDFIIAKRGSPFIAHLICGLKFAQRRYFLPYLTTMISTGPMYVDLQYLTYEHKKDVKILEANDTSTYLGHIKGASWHRWDGVAIWWLFTHQHLIVNVILKLVVGFIFYRVARMLLRRNSGIQRWIFQQKWTRLNLHSLKSKV